mgnify:FL=1
MNQGSGFMVQGLSCKYLWISEKRYKPTDGELHHNCIIISSLLDHPPQLEKIIH